MKFSNRLWWLVVRVLPFRAVRRWVGRGPTPWPADASALWCVACGDWTPGIKDGRCVVCWGESVQTVRCAEHGEQAWGGWLVCERCRTVVHESNVEDGQDYCTGCGAQLIDNLPERSNGTAALICTPCARLVAPELFDGDVQ